MGTKYTTQGITGYNVDPPDDDGSQTPANKVAWATHTGKIGGPIVAQVEAIDTKIVNMVDVAPNARSGAYTTVEDDDGRIIECTSSPTITLGLATTMGSGYVVTVKCVSGTTTVTLGGADEIDGSTSDRTLQAGDVETYVVNDAADGYLINAGVATNDWTYLDTFASSVSNKLGENTAIPSGTEEIKIVFNAVSVSVGSVNVGLELGITGPTYSTSADGLVYDQSGTLAFASGRFYVLKTVSASDNVYGVIRLHKVNGANVWVGESQMAGVSTGNEIYVAAGRITLTGVLTAIKIIDYGTGNFDGASSADIFVK